MAEVSREVIVLAQSSKLQRKIHNLELPWQAIDILVSDHQLPAAIATTISNQGVKVICAQPE